jgi:hypothetical protein
LVDVVFPAFSFDREGESRRAFPSKSAKHPPKLKLAINFLAYLTFLQISSLWLSHPTFSRLRKPQKYLCDLGPRTVLIGMHQYVTRPISTYAR